MKKLSDIVILLSGIYDTYDPNCYVAISKNKVALPACYRCAAAKLPGAFRFKQNKLYFLLSSYCCTMFALVFSVLRSNCCCGGQRSARLAWFVKISSDTSILRKKAFNEKLFV